MRTLAYFMAALYGGFFFGRGLSVCVHEWFPSALVVPAFVVGVVVYATSVTYLAVSRR